jgi:hypothetical protein
MTDGRMKAELHVFVTAVPNPGHPVQSQHCGLLIECSALECRCDFRTEDSAEASCGHAECHLPGCYTVCLL